MIRHRLILGLTFGLVAPITWAQQPYNPVLLNLSTLLDFNPVRGEVKTIDAVGADENGSEIFTLHAALSADGCVQTLRREGEPDINPMNLVKEGNFLKGTLNGEPVTFGLNSKCNLISRDDNSGHLDYKTNAQGQLGEIWLNTLKIADHFYDTQGNIKQAQFYSGELVASTINVTYPDSTNKPLDYTLVNHSFLNPESNSTAKNQCQYNEMRVPVLCHLTIMPKNDTGRVKRIAVTTRATFY